MANEIQIYKNNSKTVTCTVQGLSGYTAVLTVKTAINATGTTFTSTGTSVGDITTFELLPTQTNIEAGQYHYDIVYSNGSKNYTVVQSVLTIKDSVRY